MALFEGPIKACRLQPRMSPAQPRGARCSHNQVPSKLHLDERKRGDTTRITHQALRSQRDRLCCMSLAGRLNQGGRMDLVVHKRAGLAVIILQSEEALPQMCRCTLEVIRSAPRVWSGLRAPDCRMTFCHPNASRGAHRSGCGSGSMPHTECACAPRAACAARGALPGACWASVGTWPRL